MRLETGTLESDVNIETLFKVEPPLTDIKEGYGYLGVLLRHKTEDKLQCHVCGEWFKALPTHVQKKHFLSTEQYRREFQLPLSFPLCSLSTSSAHSKRAMRKENLEILKKHRNPTKASRSRGRDVHSYFRSNASFLNRNDACVEQVFSRYRIICDELGKIANDRDLRKWDQSLSALIRRRYGKWNNFKRAIGLPTREKPSTKNEEVIIASLRNFYEKNKRIPRSRDYRKGQSVTEPTVRKYFGSWSRAINAAGLYQQTEEKPCQPQSPQ
jgi:hypothetical protein